MNPLYILDATTTAHAQFHQLPAQALRCWRVLLFFSLGFFTILTGFGYWIFTILPILPPVFIPIGVGLIALYILLFAFNWHHTNLRYQRTQYAIDEQQIIIRQGVWWRRESIVARTRVQYVDVQQSPLARYFNLASVTIYTAGSMMPAVILKDLAPEQAQHIRNTLIGAQDDASF